MRHIPIIGKFLVILCAFGLFVGGVTTYTANRMSYIDTSYSNLISFDAKATTMLVRASRSLVLTRAAITDLLIARTDAADKDALSDIDANRALFAQQMDEAAKAMPANTAIPALKTLISDTLSSKCNTLIENAVATTDEAGISKTQAEFSTACQPAFDDVIAKLSEENQRITKATDDRNDALSDVTHGTILTTILGVAAGLFAILAASFFAIRAWVTRPLTGLSETMTVLANGNLEANVTGTDRRDEVGGMARAVQVFKDNGLRTRALEASSEAQRLANEAERQRNQDIERIRAEAMTQATDGLAEGLKRMADGDLQVELQQPFSAEFEELRHNFNAAVSQLRTTLQSVSQTTTSIDAGSRELSQAASDLSRRTEQQAAALEETAAALDQITANVSQSSKRAEEARGKASEANASAHHSAKVVSEAIDAMQRIETSSSQISSIIGVIDEIAFQTNLLALNAGVEAARAGEAGKGFAVVAQEVRELAQRSAKAAKEIKDLIRNSAGEVEGGVRLVMETGEALKVIGQHVNDINAQLDAIATSSREQSVGLAEVNAAVNQMDQTTQQNAAMVEQSTAASASLATEADRLRQLVGQFQVGGAMAAGGGRGFAAVATPAAVTPAPARAHVKVATQGSPRVASPAKRMVDKLASAFGGGAKPATEPTWDEF